MGSVPWMAVSWNLALWLWRRSWLPREGTTIDLLELSGWGSEGSWNALRPMLWRHRTHVLLWSTRPSFTGAIQVPHPCSASSTERQPSLHLRRQKQQVRRRGTIGEFRCKPQQLSLSPCNARSRGSHHFFRGWLSVVAAQDYKGRNNKGSWIYGWLSGPLNGSLGRCLWP